MRENNDKPCDSDSDEEADLFCPALPPHLLDKNKTEETRVVGPTLPHNYKPDDLDYNKSASFKDEKSDIEDDDEIFGPIPSVAEDDKRFNVPEMEYRMNKIIAGVSTKDENIKERESWMLELPSDKPKILALGLGARQFRKKNAEEKGDRSIWTDTPEDKERKKHMKKDSVATASDKIEDIASKRRDEELSKIVSKFDEKKRNVPLIDSHRAKKAKREEGIPKERKPFSREDDMNVNKFDEAQKETIMKKARQLNDRFSSGNRKFL